ncbi:MAG: SbcC/MukB-like Walker B domain-containing protein, partial [Enterococcus aquimarinus]
ILHHRITDEAALTTLAWPELTVLEAAYEQVKEQETLAYKALLEWRNQQTRNQALIEQLHVLWQKNQDALEELGELQHLSATLRGDNPEKLSLERYLLQSFLQEVLMVANQRLVKLTRGRYQFLLAEEKGSYRNSTGLEINIYDDNAGTTRRSQTLSGGESFIAALALALSLADVIQQQSGGVSIEALFIDEGFGSLDEESLEMALEALEMIEQEGRLIGIISHVRELKDRIVQQLIVETNGAGQSQTRTKIG